MICESVTLLHFPLLLWDLFEVLMSAIQLSKAASDIYILEGEAMNQFLIELIWNKLIRICYSYLILLA